MVSVKRVFNKLSVWYDGVDLSKIPVLKDYGDFLCSVIDSYEKHTGAITLHTGSEYYLAIAVAVSALGCLFYHNTDNSELIESLSVGDLLILDGQRVRFLGIIDGDTINMPNIKYFSVCTDDKTKSEWHIPFESALKKSISLYNGSAEKLGRKGIRNTLKVRKNFLSAFSDEPKAVGLSTEIDHSVAYVLDRNTAEKLYREIYFTYEDKEARLSDIFTASYYSEEECYQIGNNPNKEEPLLKFFSRVSSCRNALMDDRQRRIIGCIVGNENLWTSNSEIGDIVDRKGLKFAVMLGKTHYTNYLDWYQSDSYRFYAYVPETVKSFLNTSGFSSPRLRAMKKELFSFYRREISARKIQCKIDRKTVTEIKNRLLRIKREYPNGENKENFLMESYFLLNLCRSSFFPLSYCDKAHDKKLLSWTMSDKIKTVKDFESGLIGETKEDAEFIATGIEQMISEIYHVNPKGEAVKNSLIRGRHLCIVTTKAYYENIFSLWLDDYGISFHPRIVTVSAFQKNEEPFDDVIFPTVYYDFSFNPYASFGFASGEILLYDYEEYQNRSFEKTAESGRRLLHNKNATSYHISALHVEPEPITDNPESDTFETEMERLTKELQLKGAYRYISSAGSSRETVAKIEKIFTFASGNIGYFTKYYKGYRICGEVVSDVDLADFNVGDNMVFTKQSENKDIVDLLMEQLLQGQFKNTDYPEFYRLSLCWKQSLRDYKKMNELTYQQLADRLANLGCPKHQVTIRSWLAEESHIVGPRDANDYKAIVALTKLTETPERIKDACEEIRSLRMRILDLLGKAIIRGMFTDEKDPVSALVYQNAEDLTQIEQITSITNSGADANVPIYMINKPFEA